MKVHSADCSFGERPPIADWNWEKLVTGMSKECWSGETGDWELIWWNWWLWAHLVKQPWQKTWRAGATIAQLWSQSFLVDLNLVRPSILWMAFWLISLWSDSVFCEWLFGSLYIWVHKSNVGWQTDSECHSIVEFLLNHFSNSFPVLGISKTQPRLNMQEYPGVTGLIDCGDRRLFIEKCPCALWRKDNQQWKDKTSLKYRSCGCCARQSVYRNAPNCAQWSSVSLEPHHCCHLTI